MAAEHPYRDPSRPVEERIDDLLARNRPDRRVRRGRRLVRGGPEDAILDLVFGRFAPTGTLPFELPSSTEAVECQLPDVPCDSEAPLFPLGHGLTFAPVETPV